MTPIVLIPGLLSTAEVFAHQSAALWPHGPVQVASTLGGATVGETAEAILADAPARFALAGISMGGYLAFEIMRRAPDRVIRLALLDTSALPDTPEQTAKRRALVEAARIGDFDAVVAEPMRDMLLPARRDDAGLLAMNRRMARAVGLDGLIRQQETIISRPDSRGGLAAIEVPTLVLVGDGDTLTPPERAREIASDIPGARLVIIPDCGHASTIEQPEAVSRALIDWITH